MKESDRDSTPWHALDVDRVAASLDCDAQTGLSDREADARLERDGPNLITAKPGEAWWKRLFIQFHAPLVYLLLVAVVVTFLLGEHVDSAVILGVVIVNAVIGYVQETRAMKAIDALARTMKIEAMVRRAGRRRRIPAAELVAGDIVLLEPGDKAPADLRLLSARDLSADESMLTGESEPVAKHTHALDEKTVLAERRNMVYAGSLVTRGHGEGVVVATADSTEIGRISGMISGVEEIATPLTRKIAGFSRLLVWIILAVAALTFAVGILQGATAVEMFMASVALAVGAIPEGLPAAVTIMLAVGVGRMASRNAIIRKLPAVEALGSTTVICSDKTGTLTQNQMTVREIFAGGRLYAASGAGYDPAGDIIYDDAPTNVRDHPALDETIVCGALCNDAELFEREDRWLIQGDPTEGALVVLARKAGLAQTELAVRLPRIDALLFESEHQYMATLHRDEDRDESVVYVKGAVERVLSMCRAAMDAAGEEAPLDVAAIESQANLLAGRGLRVLALGRRVAGSETREITRSLAERDLTFLGLTGMLDPPRPEAVLSIAACHGAGIRVKMITGDHAATAVSIAAMMNLEADMADAAPSSAAITGAQMAEIPDIDLPSVVEETPVFARMTPEQKLRLVQALQQRGHVVAMTGDGVNDAPALRQADIGVAMGLSGAEAAKDAADIVLADDNFASIEAAVEEGRAVFSNLTKFISWTLPTNGGEAFVIIAAIGLGMPLPILPGQALFVNTTTGVLLGVPLIFEMRTADIMSRPPRDPRRPILTFELFMRTGLVSLLLAIGAMILFNLELKGGADEEVARTVAVSVIVIGEIFYLFSARALSRPCWSVPLLSNLWLWGGIAAMLAAHAAFVHTPLMNRLFHTAPLDVDSWVRIALVGALVLIGVEIEKAIRRFVHHGADSGDL